MGRKRSSEAESAWRERLARHKKSGLTVAEFCQREGVSTATFYGWKRKLQVRRSPRAKQAAGRRKAGSPRRRQDHSSATSPNVPFVQLPVSAPAASPWIEVVLAEGTLIRLPQQNLAALQTVLRSLNGTTPVLADGEVRYA